jgi:hypothetical protein
MKNDVYVECSAESINDQSLDFLLSNDFRLRWSTTNLLAWSAWMRSLLVGYHLYVTLIIPSHFFPTIRQTLHNHYSRLILDVLDIVSLFSIHKLARVMGSAIPTISWHLIRSVRLTMNHFHCFPQDRMETQTVQYVTLWNESLHKPSSIKYHGSYFVVTLDGPRLYFPRKHEQILLQPEHKLPERPGHPIRGKRTIVMIAWSTLGFSWSNPFQSGECLILSTNVTIFSQQWYHSANRMAEENSLETQATPRSTQRKHVKLFSAENDL